jgi:hypothetical protein
MADFSLDCGMLTRFHGWCSRHLLVSFESCDACKPAQQSFRGKSAAKLNMGRQDFRRAGTAVRIREGQGLC